MGALRGSLVGSTALVAVILMAGARPARADQVIPDDLIVQGSICAGFDCINNESFGFATVKLKENNLRILFDDTSTSAGFPATDWQLTANDTASGGRSFFAIDNVTSGTRPFMVLDGAGNNALVVGSNSKVGIGTDNPLLDLHIQRSDTPAIRLEQTNAGGFTAQTWDIGANEANFFVRDLTNGSLLPFRIRPGAPTSSIDIAASGNVGIGTASPLSKLHVSGLATVDTFGTFGPGQSGIGGTGVAGDPGLTVGYAGSTLGDGGALINAYSSTGTAGHLALATDGATRMVIDGSGNVGIGTTTPTAQLSTTGSVRFAGLSGCGYGLVTNASGDLGCGANGAPFVSNNTSAASAPVASGADSTAGGYGAQATGANSTAVGNNATATGPLGGSTAYGYGAAASGNFATATGIGAQAVGDGSVATGGGSIAVNPLSTATGASSTALGTSSTATGASASATQSYATATGYAAMASGIGSTASGGFSTASGQNSTASGYGSYAAGSGSSAYGNDAAAGGLRGNAVANDGTTAIGDGARAGAAVTGWTNATAVGAGAQANNASASAFGQGAQANAAGSVALGQGSVADQANTVSVGTVGGERRIVNVAAGTISASSTEAVNGSQLFAIGQQGATNAANTTALGTTTAAALGGGSTYSPSTGVSAPSYTVQGGSYGNVGGALGALDAQITTNTADIAQNRQTIATTNQRAASAFGGGAGVDASGLLTAPSYTVQGASYTNVGGALGALDTQTTANMNNIAALQNGQSGTFRDNNTSGDSAPQATGANAVAGGFGSIASGGSTVAIGHGAQATQFGATAVGAGAVASGDPTTAMGFNAQATGNEASAYGAFATASGDNSTALGRSANAGSANAVAVGAFASAAQANSVAIGTGVTTTRANQVAIGSSTQTYTLAGVSSAASLAAQTGPTRFVTTDANGNLATSSFDPASVAALDGRVTNLEAGLSGLSRYAIESRKEARRGIAAAMALSSAPLPSAPGRLTYALNGATFLGEYAFGGSIAYRLDTNVPLAITGGVSGGTGGNVGGRIGIMGEL